MYKTKTISFDTRFRVFWTLVILSGVSLTLYIYGVTATVRNTVARQSLEAEVMNISTDLGEMEFTYIGLMNGVSLQVAYERGFKDVTSPVYISRAQNSLSMNTLKR
jgi:hypothetical protein